MLNVILGMFSTKHYKNGMCSFPHVHLNNHRALANLHYQFIINILSIHHMLFKSPKYCVVKIQENFAVHTIGDIFPTDHSLGL